MHDIPFNLQLPRAEKLHGFWKNLPLRPFHDASLEGFGGVALLDLNGPWRIIGPPSQTSFTK